MLAVKGVGQVVMDEMGDIWNYETGTMYSGAAPGEITGPLTGVSIPTYNPPTGSNMAPGWSSDLLKSITTIGASIAQNLTRPTAKIAGPYGVSSIPVQGASGNLGGGAGTYSLSSTPMVLVLAGAALVLMAFAGKR